MIEQIQISNFKGFERLEMPDVTPITLLGGRNNVGKSTVLEAVFTFFDRLNPRLLFSQLGWRGTDNLPIDPEALWAPAFHAYNTKRDIEVRLRLDGRWESLIIHFNAQFGAQTIPPQQPTNGKTTPTVSTDQPPSTAALEIEHDVEGIAAKRGSIALSTGPTVGLAMQMEQLAGDTRQVALIHLRQNENTADLATRFGKLDIVGRQNEVVKFLRIIEPNLHSLSAISNGVTTLIHGDIGIGRKIPIAYMGDGLVRLLSMIIYIATNENGVLLIDEVESGIHYSVMPKVWLALAQAGRDYKCQIIGTTHSYECLDAAREGLSGEFQKDFTYIRLDKKEDSVRSHAFDYSLLTDALAANVEIR